MIDANQRESTKDSPNYDERSTIKIDIFIH